MSNIVILNSQTMPYHMSAFAHLAHMGYAICIVNKDWNTLSSYRPNVDIENITIHPRSNFNLKSLLKLLNDMNPAIILCAGTLDKVYLNAIAIYRKSHNVPSIMFSDTQWQGGLQWLNVFLSRWRHRKWFSHALVAGVWQYEYARRLGFDKHHILMPYLSANDLLFKDVDLNAKRVNWPKRLLYCGRFANVKGLDLLYQAWDNIADHLGWTLTLIGEGPLKMPNGRDIEVVGYKTQTEILEYMRDSGAFILPSRFEPWAIVIHEAALAGLPIICSDCVGASTAFCINGSNSFIFKSNSVLDLQKVLLRFIEIDDESLFAMGQRSRELSARISSTDVANAILSVIK